jgi:transcription elongation factor Elf1
MSKTKKLTTKQKLLDEAKKAGRAQAALELLGLPDLSDPTFDKRVDQLVRRLEPEVTEWALDEEPDACVGCGNEDSLIYRKLSINGKDNRKGWICDNCGHAHVACRHEVDFKTVTPADGVSWILDARCGICGRSCAARIDPDDFQFE